MVNLNKRIQNIGNINNSDNILIINGDVIIDSVEYSRLEKSLFEILRSDFEKYSSAAVELAKLEVNNFIKDILEKLYLSHKLNLLEQFQKLSLQPSLRETLRGYVFSEDSSTKLALVISLITRIEINNTSIEASIIDDAIAIIPNLNPTTFSLLAIMALRHFIVYPEFSMMFEMYFASLSPVVDNFSNVTDLCMEYLIAKGCVKEIHNFQRVETLENIFLHNYDLFFRSKGCYRELQDFSILHPEIMYKVNDKGTSMFLTDVKNNEWSFIDVSSIVMYERLHLRHQDYLIPLIEELKRKTPLYNVSELQQYFRKINKNWDIVFSIMSSEKMIQTVLNPVGLFIGTQYLTMYTGGNPLPISSYKL